MPTSPESLFAKIKALPPHRVAEVEDFVDFIRQRERTDARDDSAKAAVTAMDRIGGEAAATGLTPEDVADDLGMGPEEFERLFGRPMMRKAG